MLDLAGLDAPLEAEGVSLVSACLGKADPDRILFSEFYQSPSAAWGHRMHPTRMAQWRNFKYIYTHGMRDQLFDRGSDPDELDDVADEPGRAEVLAKLRHACLRDWELDAHPQLSMRGCRKDGRISLSWESVGAGANYTVWREPVGREPVAVAAGLGRTDLDLPDDGGPHRYRVVGSPALVRTFTDPNGGRRYGEGAVLAEDYPSVLPVSGLLVIDPGQESAEVDYQPWHGFVLGGQEWIYEGMPPVVSEDSFAGSGPVAILSSRPHVGNLRFEIKSLEVEPGEGAESDESAVTLVFAWLSQSAYCGVSVDAGGGLELFRREGSMREILGQGRLLRSGGARNLSLSLKGKTFDLSHGGRSLIRWTCLESVPPGRFGFNVGLQVGNYRVAGGRRL